MAGQSNKLIPVLALVLVAIVATILFQRFSGPSNPKAGAPLTQVPLPTTSGADADTPNETLQTVVASNKLLRERVEDVIKANKDLQDENSRLMRYGPRAGDRRSAEAGNAAAAGSTGATGRGANTVAPESRTTSDVFSSALDTASGLAGGIMNNSPLSAAKAAASQNTASQPNATTDGYADTEHEEPQGAVSYKLIPPMGYAAQTTQQRSGSGPGVTVTRYVRTTQGDAQAAPGTVGPAGRAAQDAGANKPQSIPYFTIPENATLAGVTAMSSLIGRVPIDGRVTDPMQFKAIVGRDNLAANGFELPDDLAGMIVTGVAIGDMALSCSEGKIRSMTFIFNDGSIRTTSSRRGAGYNGGGNVGTSTGAGTDLGYISDEHGNPCVAGKFVTNAASYLTDIVGAKGLGVASQAFADAERTVSDNGYRITSAVTGDRSRYVMGQAASGASDELTKWLMQRLKNSFDAVVTPAGAKLVVHLDQEIQLDKAPGARKLVYQSQGGQQLARGARHGLE